MRPIVARLLTRSRKLWLILNTIVDLVYSGRSLELRGRGAHPHMAALARYIATYRIYDAVGKLGRTHRERKLRETPQRPESGEAMALSTGVELAMGGEDEDALGARQYMCIGAMAVTVSSYKLLELGVGPQYGRLCQALIFAICIPLYLGAFDKTAKRVQKVGLAGFNKFGQSLAVSIEYDRRVVMGWVWDAANKLDEFELTQRCRLKNLDDFAVKGDVDVIAVVENSVLASHGAALVASTSLVLCDATPLTDQELRQRLLAAAVRSGQQLRIAWPGTSSEHQLASVDVFRTHSKRGKGPAPRSSLAGWAEQLQQLTHNGRVSSVKLTFTQPILEVKNSTSAGAAFANIRGKLNRRLGGSSGTMVLHEGTCSAALSAPWAAALDGRLTHALGCAMLALHQQRKEGDPSAAAELACEPELRWQVVTTTTTSASTSASKHPKKLSKAKDKETDEHDADKGSKVNEAAQLVVTVVTTSGDSHTNSYTISAAAEADSKHTSRSGVGAIVPA